MPKTTIIHRVANAYDAFTGQNQQQKTVNSTRGTAENFLRYGNRGKAPIQLDTSDVELSDKDMYMGDTYAVINKRANRASALGKKFLFTEGSPAIIEAAQKAGKPLEHPYLKLIRQSKEFSRRKFWHDISTYLDLEGVYYLMAVRAIKTKANGEVVVGAVQKFQMLNPYQVQRVIKQSDGTIGGYIESKNGLYREIPKEMIIEIRLLNPFDNDISYSMTDAAKETVFTSKQANDYTRHAIKGNINAPGAISTGIELEDHIFDNFVARIQNHSKGEPLYGNGTGAINWSSMQIDLDKAGLDKINEISRSTLYSVAGVSDMLMGRQKAGTGREVSKTQKDEFTENAIMPQVEDILDALNLDYRKWYAEWEQNEYEIVLDNPLEADREAELKDIEIREAELSLRDALLAKGYEYTLANKYAHGDITLEELGEPTLEPELTDEEADRIAAEQLNQTTDESDDEPQDSNTVEEIDNGDVVNTNRVLTTNEFVDPKINKKKIRDAIKRRKIATTTTADDKKVAKEAEEQSEGIIKDEEDKKKLSEEEKDKKKTRVVVEVGNEVEQKAINQVSIRENFPDLYEGLVIDQRAVLDDKYRGCIMINTVKIPVTQFVKNGDADLVEATDRHDHTMGAVAEIEPHATLLYGLLNNGNIWKDKVDSVLTGWEMPTVKIKDVSYFQLEDSKAVIALLEETPEIIDANKRLSLLPHLNTFSEYHPHITLAYITDDADVDKWVKALGKKYNGQVVATEGINYGDEPVDDDKTENHIEDEHDFSKPIKKKAAKQINAAASHSKHSHAHLDENHVFAHNSTLEVARNALDPAMKDSVILQEANLENAVRGLEADIVNAVIKALREGNITKAENIIEEAQEEQFTGELALVLAGFFTVLFPIYASQLFVNRLALFGKQGVFGFSDDIKRYIDESARNAAESHVSTVLKELTDVLDQSIEFVTQQNLITIVQDKVNTRDENYTKKLPTNPNTEDIKKAVESGKFDNDPAYKLARDLIREGEGLNQVVKTLQQAYTHISSTRAKTIARHESSRVFNMSQYQADLQFLVESNNMNKAYKRLRSRVDNPCAVCAMLITQTRANPIPFRKNFADLGDELTATYRKDNGKMAIQKLPISYEAIKAGNVHVNCNCEYELVIKNDDGTYNNAFDFRVNNGKGDKYNPYRAKDGKFASGPGQGGDGSDKDDSGSSGKKAREEKYPGRKKGEGFEAYGNRYLKENEMQATIDYQKQVMEAFKSPIPNIVAADEAKKIIPGFNPERSADYHEPSSAFVKKYYTAMLANDSTKHLPVVFTAGGTGAGKSTALTGEMETYDQYAAVYDGNMAGYDSAKGKIDAALKTGRKVEIAFVDRDPVTAFKYGVIPRVAIEGRAVTIEDHMQTHLNSRDAIARLAKTYEGNDMVNIKVIDNNGGIGDAHQVPLDNLTGNVYNKDKLREELNNEAKEAKDDGRISEGVYELITGKSTKDTSSGQDGGKSESSEEPKEVADPDFEDNIDPETGMGTIKLGKDKKSDEDDEDDESDTEEEIDEDTIDFGHDQDGYEVKDYIIEEYSNVEFTSSEKAAIHEYTGGRYQSINNLLRHGEAHYNDESPEKTKEILATLEKLTAKSKLVDDTILYRGSGFDDELEVGMIINDKGFSSTSLQAEVAEEFINSEDNEEKEFKYVMRIKAPKDTQGLFPATAGVAGEENEFVLPPNTSFKVVAINEPEDDFDDFGFGDGVEYKILEIELV